MMKGSFKYKNSRGLPGGPNEQFTYVTGVFSIEGYKRNSPDVNNPFNIIPSGNITMKDVDFPVLGVDNLGNSKIMQPGKDYKFPGNTVFEMPVVQKGGEPPIERINLNDFVITNKELAYLNDNQEQYCPGGNCLEGARKAFDITTGRIPGIPFTGYVWDNDLNLSSTRETPSYEEVRRNPWFAGDEGSGSADSWDIQGSIVNSGGTILYNINDPDLKYESNSAPIGSIYSFGPKGESKSGYSARNKGYNTKFGLQPSHHSAIKVGVNEKGESILYDAFLKKYGTEKEITSEVAKRLPYELETIGVPKSYAGLTPDNIKNSNYYFNPKTYTNYNLDVDYLEEIKEKPEFKIKVGDRLRSPGIDKKDMTSFGDALKENKEQLLDILNIDSQSYDNLANLAVAIAMAESEGGDALSFIEGATKGLTQLNFDNIKNDPYLKKQIDKYNKNVPVNKRVRTASDLYDPYKSAIASIVYLSSGIARSNLLYQQGIEPGIRNFYDNTGIVDYFRSSSAKINKDGLYLEELNSRIDFDDIPGWNDKDTKKATEYLNAITNTDRYEVANKDGELYLKMKTKGNSPMSEAMRIGYWWQSPNSLKTGDAQGNNVHARRINDYYKFLSDEKNSSKESSNPKVALKQRGGEPIYVTDKNDPRYKAYQDSLLLHNNILESFTYSDGLEGYISSEFTKAGLNPVYPKSTLDEYVKSGDPAQASFFAINDAPSTAENRFAYSRLNSFLGEGEYPRFNWEIKDGVYTQSFPKPTQPVIYKPWVKPPDINLEGLIKRNIKTLDTPPETMNIRQTPSRQYKEEDGKYYMRMPGSKSPNALQWRPITKRTYDLKPQYQTGGEKTESNYLSNMRGILGPTVFPQEAALQRINREKKEAEQRAALQWENTQNLRSELNQQGISDNTSVSPEYLQRTKYTPPTKSGLQGQTYIEEYNAPSVAQQMRNRLANPLTTFGYAVRGEKIPDRIPFKGNPYDMALDVVNPFSWLDYGISSGESLAEGDIGMAALNALGAIPTVPVGGKYVKKLLPNHAINTLPKAKNFREALGTIAGIPAERSLARLSPEELKIYRAVQQIGRMEAVNKPLHEVYEYALKQNIPDEHLKRIFYKTRSEIERELPNLIAEQAKIVQRPPTGSINLRRPDNYRRSTIDRDDLIREATTEEYQRFIRSFEDLGNYDSRIANWRENGIPIDEFITDNISRGNVRPNVRPTYSKSSFKNSTENFLKELLPKPLGIFFEHPVYLKDVKQNVPSLFLRGSDGLKDISKTVNVRGTTGIKSGDVFTGSLNTSHSSYLPQLKQVFKYKDGAPQFLGYRPMNQAGFLSNYEYPLKDIARYLNTEIDRQIARGIIPKNIQRPYVNSSNYISLPQYGIKQFQPGGEYLRKMMQQIEDN